MSIAIRHIEASASDLHALPMPTSGGAELWIMKPTSPALVMGSAQRPEQFDLARLGIDRIELASRRSGGGAVFIDPNETVWIDLLAPSDSAFWSSDLAENFRLVGRLWHRALGALGVDTVLVDQGPTDAAAGRIACWAGLGWGELTVDGSKLVGLSQRRTRWGSRVQAIAVLGTSSGRVLDYLPAHDRAAVGAGFSAAHVEVLRRADVDPQRLEAAVIGQFRS